MIMLSEETYVIYIPDAWSNVNRCTCNFDMPIVGFFLYYLGVSGYSIGIFGSGFGDTQGTFAILGQSASITEWWSTLVATDIDTIAARYKLIPGPDLYMLIRLNIERDNSSWFWPGDPYHQNYQPSTAESLEAGSYLWLIHAFNAAGMSPWSSYP